MRMRGTGLKMRGIREGIRRFSVRMRGLGMRMQEIRVGMRRIGEGNPENQNENLRIGVEMINEIVWR